MFLVSATAALVLQDKPGRPLGIDGQKDQERYASLRTSRAYKDEKATVLS
ncbi:hypothetical protein COCCU_13830 [Corynebacterium occultum]|uniref:Uncharacterized protein n=1 Tax=Corynebacterium occultum TaxID=2675219 RepID=A0A6B8WCR9_9CORY|nr:hypothetical protein [Corynebacterium occultum]QGU08656.1 hypothetical protein COCCU_13830 [Corynebacterium occultum]